MHFLPGKEKNICAILMKNYPLKKIIMWQFGFHQSVVGLQVIHSSKIEIAKGLAY